MSWMSSKQKVVACSNTETKYRALAIRATEVTWLQLLLSELKIAKAHALVLFTDNINAKYLVANSMKYGRMKHVKIDFYFIRDLMVNNRLDVRYTPTEEQIAYAMTKPLEESRFVSENQAQDCSTIMDLRGLLDIIV